MATPTLYNFIKAELHNQGFNNEIVDKEDNLVFFDQDFQIMPKILSYDEDVEKIVNGLFAGLSLNTDDTDRHFKQGFMYRFMNRQISRQTIEAFKFQLMSTFLMNEDYINKVYEDMEKYLQQTQTSNSTNEQTHSDTTKENSEQSNTQTESSENKETSQQDNTQEDKSTNSETVDGSNTTDNRSANASLPQNNVTIDVNDTTMEAADTNDISRNKQTNTQDSDGESTTNSTGNTTGENTGETSGQTQSDGTSQSDSESDGESQSSASSANKSYQLDELFKTNGVLEHIYNLFDEKCFMQIW